MSNCPSHAEDVAAGLITAAEDVVRQAAKARIMLPADLADSIRVFLKPALDEAKDGKRS